MSNTFFKRTVIVIFLGIILAFYLWTASSSGNPFQFAKKIGDPYHYYNYYNLLTDAFLAGQLSLLVEPKKELLAMADRYDPNLHRGLGLSDASLYKGKYYLYFGPAPALTLFIPSKVIFGRYLDQNFAIAFFCFGGLVWSILLLNFLTRTYLPKAPFWMRFLAIFCLSFSNVAPYILRHPAVYEVAISCGYFFLMGSLYWLVSGGLEGRPRLWRLFLGSLFLGLAVGSRFHLVFAAVFLFILGWRLLKNQCHYHVWEARREFFGLFMPFGVCVALLGLYNYLRFDSWIEFGIQYQFPQVFDMPKFNFFTPSRILPGLYFLFLDPCRISLEFPFMHLAPQYPWPLPADYYGPEPVAGVLANIPFLNILSFYPACYKWLRDSESRLSLVLTFFILLALAIAGFTSITACASMRYVVDFVSLLLCRPFFYGSFWTMSLLSKKPIRFFSDFFPLRLFSMAAYLIWRSA